ncbi:MAG: PDZ domain-containing protein [Chitinophagaceae bacterium]
MKKVLFAAATLGFMAFAPAAQAQEEITVTQNDKKESQEIYIRKKGDKDAKITVVIKGDKVTINGKPLSEFKDDNITINKRYITVFDKNGNKEINLVPGEFMNNMRFWKDSSKAVTYTFLGVSTDDAEQGAKIINVTKESAAEKAGLQKDDIINAIGDKKIDGPAGLSEYIRSLKPKDEVTIYYTRDGKSASTRATLGERKEENSFAMAFSAPNDMSGNFSRPYVQGVPMPRVPGMNNLDGLNGNNFEVFDNMFPRKQKLGLKIQDTEDGNGVKVLDVDKDSPAEKAGLKKEDILVEIAGNKISNTDEARESLMENMDKPAYNIKAKRNGNNLSFDIKIPKKLKTTNL